MTIPMKTARTRRSKLNRLTSGTMSVANRIDERSANHTKSTYPMASVMLIACICAPFANAQPVLITAPQTIVPGQTCITPTAGGPCVPLTTAEVTVRGCTVTINGTHTLAALTIERNAGNAAGVVTHARGQGNYTFLTISGNCTIQGTSGSLVGSRIDLNSCGFPSGTGPGAGGTNGSTNGGGGGYGGRGGNGNQGGQGGATYDVLTLAMPESLGSGGGTGFSGALAGAGGGSLHLKVKGTLTVDGTISADGVMGGTNAGGGSGGSIWIDAGSLEGAGIVSANGGSAQPDGGGGGGGRIAIYSSTIGLSASNIRAFGGNGMNRGGAGTVYVKLVGDPLPSLALDAGSATVHASTPLSGAWNLQFLTIANGANAVFDELVHVSHSLNVTSASTLTGTRLEIAGDLSVSGGAGVTLSTTSGLTLDTNLTITGAGSFLQVADDLVVPGDLLLTTGGTLRHPNGDDGFHVMVAGNATVGAGASIDLNSRGFSSGTGPGQGGSNSGTNGGGAGHGGRGGNGNQGGAGGATYGWITIPTTSPPSSLGSGGGIGFVGGSGGSGGGSLRLKVEGTLTVDGAISANGAMGGSANTGGGSGGSILIEAGAVGGNGILAANGGAARPDGGGGGGGRIAIYSCNNSISPANVRVEGGTAQSPGQPGQPGSIFLSGLCYANCDCSSIAPVLNVNDFICFQTKFAAGDPYANCDGSTASPTLNINDFICFQQKFAAGCP